MTTNEIITEVKNIQTDLLDNKISYKEAIDGLQRFSDSINIDFSVLYNAFYSSQPEIYFY